MTYEVKNMSILKKKHYEKKQTRKQTEKQTKSKNKKKTKIHLSLFCVGFLLWDTGPVFKCGVYSQ